MEFKGTKGKWFPVEIAGFYDLKDGAYYEDNNLLDCDVFEVEEVKANALLMSKAPEMLEMLNNISQNAGYICNDSGVGYLVDDDDMEKLRNLIKSATEL